MYFFAKFGWNWPSGSVKEYFKIFASLYISPLGKMRGPSLNKLLNPSPKDGLHSA